MNELNPIRILRTRGLRGTIQKIKDKLLFREIYFYSCSLSSRSTSEQYKLVPADKSMLGQIYKQYRDEVTPNKYELLLQRLECSTEQCLLICSNQDKICGYSHIAYADHYNAWSNLQVTLDPGQVYLFDDYVFKVYRGGGLHKFSIAQRMHLAGSQGYTSAMTIIDKTNIPSHRAYTSMGFQRTKLLWHLPLLKKNIPRQM